MYFPAGVATIATGCVEISAWLRSWLRRRLLFSYIGHPEQLKQQQTIRPTTKATPRRAQITITAIPPEVS